MDTITNPQLKSEYELLMDRLEKEGKVQTYSDEESLKIFQNLTKGEFEFCLKNTIALFQSEQELRNIVLL